MRNYSKAIECFKKDLAISEPILGEGHKRLLDTYKNLGYIYEILGDRDVA